MTPLFVLAGNYRQFREWCRDHDVPPREARYIASADVLFGTPQGVRYAVSGDPWTRYDYETIMDVLRVRQAVRVDD